MQKIIQFKQTIYDQKKKELKLNLELDEKIKVEEGMNTIRSKEEET